MYLMCSGVDSYIYIYIYMVPAFGNPKWDAAMANVRHTCDCTVLTSQNVKVSVVKKASQGLQFSLEFDYLHQYHSYEYIQIGYIIYSCIIFKTSRGIIQHHN